MSHKADQSEFPQKPPGTGTGGGLDTNFPDNPFPGPFDPSIPSPDGGGSGGFANLIKGFGAASGDAAVVTALVAIPVVGPFVAAAYLGIKNISPLLGKGQDKVTEQATAIQQAIEKAATAIEKQVADGTLDVDSALIGLKELQSFAGTLGTGSSNVTDKSNRPVFSAAGQMANVIISQIISNLSGQRNREIATPFENPDQQGNPNARGVFGSPGFQRDRLRTGLTDFFTGGLDREERDPTSIGDSLRSAGGSQSEGASFPEIALRFNDPLERLDEFREVAEDFRPTDSPFQEDADDLGSFLKARLGRGRLA